MRHVRTKHFGSYQCKQGTALALHAFVDVIGVPTTLSDWHCMRRKQSFSAPLFPLSLPPLLFSALLLSLSLSLFLFRCSPLFCFRRAFFQPRPHSLAPSLCAVMKISQPAAHNGVPTSGAQTPQILLQAANPSVKPLLSPTPSIRGTHTHIVAQSHTHGHTNVSDMHSALRRVESKWLKCLLIRLGCF